MGIFDKFFWKNKRQVNNGNENRLKDDNVIKILELKKLINTL